MSLGIQCGFGQDLVGQDLEGQLFSTSACIHPAQSFCGNLLHFLNAFIYF